MKQGRDYAVVTLAYWAFMLTDGALRMLVLLYFHELGYSPIQLAFLFLLYEICGIGTNIVGGWLGNRFGLKITLFSGLGLQVAALLLLSLLNESWPLTLAVPFVMLAQALSGIAKDLTKMSSKTAVKFLIPDGAETTLYKWVALLTGSKNAVKGAGFFLGGFLLQILGFRAALWVMAGGIAFILVSAISSLPREIGRLNKSAKLKRIFHQPDSINILSAARVFLFGARDIWFVVGVPVYLHASLHWSFTQVGSFMATWVIGYGVIQSIAPRLTRLRTGGRPPSGKLTFELTGLMTASIVIIFACLHFQWRPTIAIISGLYLFGALFALNSSVHSFLVLQYAEEQTAAMNVGFYYSANAVGRLVGTALSGILFQLGGLEGCLAGSAAFLAITTVISVRLPSTPGSAS